MQNGETCLHAAALSGCREVVELLLNHGRGEDRCIRNWSGFTARDLALSAGHASDFADALTQPPPRRPSNLRTSSIISSSSSSTSSPKHQHVRFADEEKIERVQCRLSKDGAKVENVSESKKALLGKDQEELRQQQDGESGRTH